MLHQRHNARISVSGHGSSLANISEDKLSINRRCQEYPQVGHLLCLMKPFIVVLRFCHQACLLYKTSWSFRICLRSANLLKSFPFSANFELVKELVLVKPGAKTIDADVTADDWTEPDSTMPWTAFFAATVRYQL